MYSRSITVNSSELSILEFLTRNDGHALREPLPPTMFSLIGKGLVRIGRTNSVRQTRCYLTDMAKTITLKGE